MRKIKLGEVLDVKRGASLSGEFYSETGEKIRLTLGNFNYPGGGFKKNTSKKDIYFTGPVKPEHILKKGDIITPLTEQVSGLLGETARIPEDDLYIQSGDVGLVLPDESKLNKDFAYYLISSPIVKKQLDAASQQTKIRHTSPDAIKGCEAYLPELGTQARIASILDSINAKIENNNLAAADLESMAKLLYDYWFVQFDFPDEDGRPYKSSGGKMVWNEDLKSEIPEGWEPSSIENQKIYVSDYTANGSFAGLAENVKYDEGIPYAVLVRIVDLKNNFAQKDDLVFVNEHAYNYLSKSCLEGGELIICNVGDVGATFICPKLDVPMTLGPNGVVVKSKKYNDFLYLYFRSQYGQAQLKGISSGSVQMKFNKTNFRELPIVFPPENVLKAFTRRYSIFKEMMDVVWVENRQLLFLRDFLLPMLMNGQVGFKE